MMGNGPSLIWIAVQMIFREPQKASRRESMLEVKIGFSQRMKEIFQDASMNLILKVGLDMRVENAKGRSVKIGERVFEGCVMSHVLVKKIKDEVNCEKIVKNVSTYREQMQNVWNSSLQI